MRRLVLCGSLLGALALAASAPAGRSQAAAADSFRSGHGLHVLSVKWLNPRLADVVVKTAALPNPPSVYILFPPGYAAHPTRRYPVFYLLHGTSGGASDWTVM